ncbi:MAG: hypothetical protein ACFFCW_44270 [Candidatus Hodarchaeota archaeon]
MTMENTATLAGSVLFMAIFLFGGKLHKPAWILHHHRKALSLGAGVSVAYVFIHLLPELEAAREVFIRITEHRNLPFPEYRVYLSALIGFILFYGLDHMVVWSRKAKEKRPQKEEGGSPVFWLHIGGFAVYGWLVSYLMVRNIEEEVVPIGLYAVAMGFHFLLLEHSLRHEHVSLFDRAGRYVLAIAPLTGWIMGILTDLPKPMVITLLGFISGAIIMNTLIMELPKEKEGKFWPFLTGGVLYAAILLRLG